jgi:hypothetical protein
MRGRGHGQGRFHHRPDHQFDPVLSRHARDLIRFKDPGLHEFYVNRARRFVPDEPLGILKR